MPLLAPLVVAVLPLAVSVQSAVAFPLLAKLSAQPTVALPPLFAGEFLLEFVAVLLPSFAQSAAPVPPLAFPPLAFALPPLAVSAQPPVDLPVAVPLVFAVPLASAFLPLFYYAQTVVVDCQQQQQVLMF